MNSSTVSPACRMIALKVPLSKVAWSGTTTRLAGSRPLRMMWLPRCRCTENPFWRNAAMQARPEIDGSLLKREQLRLEIDPRGWAGHLLATIRCTDQSPPGYFRVLPPSFFPVRYSRADWGIRPPRSHPRRGIPRLDVARA